jgi:hypothetical protein
MREIVNKALLWKIAPWRWGRTVGTAACIDLGPWQLHPGLPKQLETFHE